MTLLNVNMHGKALFFKTIAVREKQIYSDYQSGLSSVLNVMLDGKRIEVGLTGKEGFVGLPLAVGFATSSTLTIIQIAATDSGFPRAIWKIFFAPALSWSET